ncbi:glycosyltransferase family 1 protein [Flavobacterium arcticum]|uniref:Glycosyltransferase family 1 protein n=1 Tax=Flavobacterium arcticum TaxID=1784713 RepID=A0A345H991_9FLAO|nr:glycosyltransferase family 4 protein [Flavobacterium arcticum]AXG73151.1 glycosyltransferase family 1 protein [Flavobacterium arcticum]KAF2512943.1 glycosyltransferase family 4 protein [Flavobacterium arcticum]
MDKKQNPIRTVVHVMGYDSKKFGGLERYILDLSKAGAPKGIKIVVVYNQKPKSVEFLKQLEDNNIKYYIANALSTVAFFKAFYRIVRTHKPIIIHSHFQPLFPSLYGYLFGCKHRWNNVRLMLVDKDIKEAQYKNQLKKSTRVYRALINMFTTRFFSVSNAVNKQYTEIYPNHAHKFEVLYNGGKINSFDKEASRSKLGFKSDVVYICCIAFASKTKGIDILIDAVHELNKKGIEKQFILCLIGLMEGSEVTVQIESKIELYGLDQLVKNFGIINNVPEVLPAMDIFVQPSRSESLSNSIIESGFAGVPAIGSNVGGIPEVIIDNETGMLFPVGDVHELATKLELLIKDDRLRVTMGQKSKQHKTNDFLMSDKINKLVDYYISI